MNTLILVLKILPGILAAVKAVEEAIPLPGHGLEKLDLVLDVIKSVYDGSAELQKQFSVQELIGVVVPMIDKIVALYNALGLFQKSSPPKTA